MERSSILSHSGILATALFPADPGKIRSKKEAHLSMDIENGRVMGIENGRVLGTESGRVGPLARGGSGATGAGQRARNAVVMTEPLSLQAIPRLFGSQGDGALWRVPGGDACGSCCLGC